MLTITKLLLTHMMLSPLPEKVNLQPDARSMNLAEFASLIKKSCPGYKKELKITHHGYRVYVAIEALDCDAAIKILKDLDHAVLSY